MASKKNPSTTHMLEDLVTCVICMEVFQNPHTLPCLHTFCQNCIHRLPMRKIACPTCRYEAELSDIKQDFKMSQLVEFHEYRNSKRKKVKYNDTVNSPDDVCQLCEVNLITDACRKCSGFFCVSCLKMHRRLFKDCLEEDVESLEVRSEYCLNKLQTLCKLVLENTDNLNKQLDEKCKQYRVEQKRAKTILHDYTVIINGRQDGKIDAIVDEHIKKLEVEFTAQGKRLTDLKQLLSETLDKSKAGRCKAFDSVSNQVHSELTECGTLFCPPLKISVGGCLNVQPVISVAGVDQLSLVELLGKDMNVTCTLHLPGTVERVQMIHGDYWCSFKSRVLVLNCYGETINTINVPGVVCVALSDTSDIIILSYKHGIYKVKDLTKGSTTCLSKIRRYHDIWIGGGHHCAVHIANGKLCLDELNEGYQIVQHKGTRVNANESFGLQLAIVDKSAFVSSAQFNQLVQIDLGSGDIVKEFNCKVSNPMFTDGHHLLISQQTGICMFKPEDGSLTPLKLPSDMGQSCYCVLISGKKLFIHYYDSKVKCWLLAVLTY